MRRTNDHPNIAQFLAVLAMSLAAGASLGAAPPLAVAPKAVRDGQLVQRHPAATFGAGVYLAAWCDGSRQVERPTADIYGGRIDAVSGETLDPAGFAVCAAEDLQEWPAAAFDGTNFLVVWQDFRNGADYDVYAARVTPAGKVLDPNGFPVAAKPANQCRPRIAYAAGTYVVVWMDARAYPVYGVYGARVSPDGAVLAEFPIDVEDQAKIDKVKPPGPSWFGDRDYWWQGLASRYLPAIASDSKRCLVVYLREYPFAESGRPRPTAALLDPRDGRVEVGPLALPSGAYDTLAACAAPAGWAVVLGDHAQGWGLAPRLAAVRLTGKLETTDAFAKPDTKEPDRIPAENLERSLMPEGAMTLNPGKGAVAFWLVAAAWDGRHIVAATDFGWRRRGDPNAITYAIAANRFSTEAPAPIDPACTVLATSERADQAVANPALAEGPAGQMLLLYERDAAVDRQYIEARLMRSDG